MQTSASPARPLGGVKVIELGTMISAPLAGMMLAGFGAEVVKVEHPKGGDPFRSFRGGLYSPNFVAYNHSKQSIRLDLQSETGRGVFRRLLERSDVLLENYRPGVLDKLGFPAEVIRKANPRTVHCSITGFGATGPYSARPAFDTIALALSGIAGSQIDPEDPQILGPTIADYVAGMYACYGVLGALYDRNRTGLGRRVEVNLLESAIAVMTDSVSYFTRQGISSGPLTRTAASQAFAFRCADGKLLALHLSRHEKFWTGLLSALERPDLGQAGKFSTREHRIQNYAALRETLSGIFLTRPSDHWAARLELNDVPFAPVNAIPEVCADPQVAHLGTLSTAEHPTEGTIVGLRCPVSFDSERGGITAPPTLGEHTDAVLASLGYTESEILEFRQSGTI